MTLREQSIFNSALGAALLLCLGCKLPSLSPTAPETLVLVIGLDTSGSSRPGDRCAEAQARVEDVVSRDVTTPMEVLLLATGNEGEPVTVMPWARFVPAERLFGDLEAEEKLRSAIVHELVARCRATIVTSARSPIFMLARRSVEAFRAHCAEIERAGGKCAQGSTIFLHSDLRENTQPEIARRLNSSRRKQTQVAVPTLPTDGLRVATCGYADFAGSGGGADVVQVWKEVLGERAIFDPVCPRSVENRAGNGTSNAVTAP